MDKEKIIKIAETNSWAVSEETYVNGKGLLFSKFSPAGQDFNIPIEPCVSFGDLLGRIKEYHDNFDIDYETYIWIGTDGHGKNGAPYHIKDLVEDIEACHKMILELYNLLKEGYDKD